MWNNYFNKNSKFYIKFTTEESQIYSEQLNKQYVQLIKYAQRKLQPELQSTNNCVIMLTVILTEPDWITIPCNEKISNLMVCQQILNYTTEETGSVQDSSLKDIFCEKGHLFIKSKCILFKQHKRPANFEILIGDQYKINKEQPDGINSAHAEYFTLVQHHFIPKLQFTLIDHSQKTFNTYTAVQSSTYGDYDWISTITNESFAHHDGYLLFPGSSRQVKVQPFLFHCADGSYIHETLICNRIDDCSTGTDEKNCLCSNSLQTFESICKHECKS